MVLAYLHLQVYFQQPFAESKPEKFVHSQISFCFFRAAPLQLKPAGVTSVNNSQIDDRSSSHSIADQHLFLLSPRSPRQVPIYRKEVLHLRLYKHVARCCGRSLVLAGNRCEKCRAKIAASKAVFKQSKYGDRCAGLVKRENSLASRLPGDRREYMRTYMAAYRLRNPGLSTQYVRKYRANRSKPQNGAQAA